MPDAREAPLLPGLPLLGNALAANEDPCRFFAKGYTALGPVFRVSYPGRVLIVLAGLEANERFARDGGRLFDAAATYARVTRELGTSELPNAVDGEAHADLRGLLAPSLSAQALEPFAPRLLRRVEDHARAWADGAVLGAADAIEPLVQDLVAICATSRPLPPGLSADVRLYGTLMGAVGVGAAGPEWLMYTPPVRRARARLAAFVEAALAEHESSPPGPHRDADLLDALLQIGRARPERFPPPVQAALGLLPFKNAGIYLYRLVSFVMYELCRSETLFERVLAEVDGAWATGTPDLGVLRRLRTLHAVVHEALRLHPMAIALPRVVREGFTLGGHDVVAGTTVYLAGPVTHFLPEVFAEPDRFDPDRFGPARNEHRRPYVYAPFGLGGHACMARSWSTSLAALVVAGILHTVRLELAPPGYRIRVRAFPNPIPEAVFRMRVRGQREPGLGREVARSVEDELSAALGRIGPDAQAGVFAQLTTVELSAGATVFRQGEAADRFFLVRRGEVEVVLEPDRVVARLGPGSHFGEIGILQGVPRTATVRAATDVTLLALGRDAFNQLAVDGELTRTEIARLLERRAVMTALAHALPAVDAAVLSRLGPACEQRVVPMGTVVIRQGAPADRFYVLTAGRVEVSNAHPSGADIVVAELVAPDHFGEIGLLEGRPRTASVRVVGGPATLLALDRDGLLALVGGSSVDSNGIAERARDRLLDLARRSADGGAGTQ